MNIIEQQHIQSPSQQQEQQEQQQQQQQVNFDSQWDLVKKLEVWNYYEAIANSASKLFIKNDQFLCSKTSFLIFSSKVLLFNLEFD